MQTAKYILSALLIVAILSTGLPIFTSKDASLSNRVMLEDAILSVQALARSVQDAGSFKAEMKKALTNLHVAAGLKTVIKTDSNAKSFLSFTSFDSPCLISSHCLLPPAHNNETIYDLNIPYQSFTGNLNPPPPRFDYLQV